MLMHILSGEQKGIPDAWLLSYLGPLELGQEGGIPCSQKQKWTSNAARSVLAMSALCGTLGRCSERHTVGDKSYTKAKLGSFLLRASLVAQMVKSLPAVWETQVRYLGQEDLGEGNGNPLQYSCLENPMDGGAWRATVHEVPKSWTWLSDFILFLTLLKMSCYLPVLCL